MAAHVRKIFIVAGEPSGDIIGSRLIRSLRQLAPDTSFEFFGVGGSHMIKDGGFHSIFPMEEISVMGLFEVLPRLPNIYNRLEATVSVLREVKPDCIVTIDSKGFNFRLLKAIAKDQSLQVPKIHYVSPSVWAFKHVNPIKELQEKSRLVDNTLLILPFEKKYYDNAGVNSTFVGHPAIEQLLDLNEPEQKHHTIENIEQSLFLDGGEPEASFGRSLGQYQPSLYEKEEARLKLTGNRKAKVLGVYPGSRSMEIEKSVPIIVNVLAAIREDIDCIVIPCVPSTLGIVQEKLGTLEQKIGKKVIVSSEIDIRHATFIGASCALAVSGTIVCELAVFGVPTVVMYSANVLTGIAARLLAKVRYVSIPNILVDEPLIAEFVFNNCRAELISEELKKMLRNQNAENDKIQQMNSVTSGLCRWTRYYGSSAGKANATSSPVRPSLVAAKTIIEYLQ